MESVKPARVILRVIDNSLSLADRHHLVQTFWDDLTQLELTAPANITPLKVTAQGETLYGLDVRIAQPERLEIWVQDIGDRLTVDHVKIRLSCIVEKISIQIETASDEEILSLLPVIDTILPARQIFQARAELYAQREGEFSPIELENLELLRDRLQLDPDTAESIKKRALGPYQDRQTKLDRYRELLNAELDRQPTLSATTEAELQRFCENLGLSSEDIAPIRATEIAKRQPPEEPEVADTEEEEPPEPEASTLELSPQQLLAIQQSYAEQYRQEFADAIARSLYPSEFDRGRLEQARRSWELDREMVRAIEREVTDERYGAIDSALGLDYTRLRQLLWLNCWEEADQETERLVLSALSRDMQPLDVDAMQRLGQYCVDVQTLDQLWSRHSEGKFGFAAQQQVYVAQDRQPTNFLAAVEWVDSTGVGSVIALVRRKAYSDLQFHLQAPMGHLPTWRWAANSLVSDYAISDDIVQQVLHNVVETCLPDLQKSLSPPTPETGDQPS